MFSHLSDRELHLLGEPTRHETLALIGWMSLNNIFGLTTYHTSRGNELPPDYVAHWVGCLRGVISCDKVNRAPEQDVVPDSRRKVVARTAKFGLATGAH